MWLKKPPKQISKSGSDNLNFLFNYEKFYIMDNHLAAAWCWLQKINTNETYNFFHIDKHYDLLKSSPSIKSEIIDKQINLQQLSLQEFLSLKQPLTKKFDTPLFRFDNYILNLTSCYPKIFGKTYFATHKDGTVPVNFINCEKEIYELDYNIEYWVESNNDNRWIFNLDIDYFFNKNERDEYYQFLTNEFICNVCDQIKKCIDSIDVITIALSPEFCGGWDNSQKVLNSILKSFNIEMIKICG